MALPDRSVGRSVGVRRPQWSGTEPVTWPPPGERNGEGGEAETVAAEEVGQDAGDEGVSEKD